MEIVIKSPPKVSLLSSDDEDMLPVKKSPEKQKKSPGKKNVMKDEESESEDGKKDQKNGKPDPEPEKIDKEAEKIGQEEESESPKTPQKEESDEEKEDTNLTPELNFDNSTDDESNVQETSSLDITQIKGNKKIYDDKKFHLNSDLSATDKIKLETYILFLKGSVTANPNEADYVIANKMKLVPKDIRAEIVKPRWIQECKDMECWIPTRRYLLDS